MTSTITSVNSSATSTLLIAADGTRTSLTIQNTDANTLYVAVGSTPATTSSGGFTFSRVLNASATLTPPESQQAIYGIWSAAGAGAATITAITDPVVDDNGTISTYAELKTALAAWLKPGTTLPTDETTYRIPEYIALFEAEANRTLRTRNMMTVDTALAVTSGSATVPTGFRQMVAVSNSTTPYDNIDYIPLDQFERLDATTTTGLPEYYTISGATILFWPAVTCTPRIRYRRGLTPLTTDNDTNWLLAKHPDAYLYGSLMNADRRLIDPERIGLVEPRYREVMRQIIEEERWQHGHGLRPIPSGFVV
ncbi:hypothetical protein UFOVP1333_3 [uncultured Caudovirales phage]|uniref:Uncharacterized protein n=1 Tax=uncultured Caudovirales phage TaxID=2100421 RepID=A0A6J5S1E6_9CAUD|nr:hypothetical protein UFOVP1333_3 [uncultured Caudovirales phage]